MKSKININSSSLYSVYAEEGAFEKAGEICRDTLSEKCKKILIVSDGNTFPIYAKRLADNLRASGYDKTDYFVMDAGEQAKSLGTLTEILEKAADFGMSRRDAIITLGGGVVGDTAGFAASVYMRGIDYIQIPTSLLAMIDSSVGGKTGVDLGNRGKNLVGTFWQPKAVITDFSMLGTLPDEFFTDGLAEAVKCGIIGGTELFTKLSNGIINPYFHEKEIIKADEAKNLLSEIIIECILIKAKLVSDDEHDNGARNALNLGHTLGHAIERLSNYSLSHGQAVSLGCCMIAKISEKLGLCDNGVYKKTVYAMRNNHLPTEFSERMSFTSKQLAEAVLSDKKKIGTEISFVIPEKIGKIGKHTVPCEKLEEFIDIYFD